MSLGEKLRARFWLLIMSFLWFALAVMTYHSTEEALRLPLWWIGAYVIGLFNLYFVAVEEPIECMATTLTALVVTYSIARSIRMGMMEEGVRMTFWLLYASLTLHAYRLGRLLSITGVSFADIRQRLHGGSGGFTTKTSI